MSAPSHPPTRMQRSLLFALSGILLGLCAPLGALGLLWFSPHPALQLPSFIVAEWKQNLFFFTYMLSGTSLAFGLFGFFLGRNADRMGRQNRRLTDQVLTDPLTGLGNHRFLHEAFQAEILRRAGSGRPLSCLMLDLDHFKRVNDSYGHPFGDTVLMGLAESIRQSLRPGDRAARYGGEEFLCILPDCDTPMASEVAELIRRNIESRGFYKDSKRVPVTVSIGLATLPARSTNYRRLIERADQALYRAKEKGRNRVESSASKD